MADNEISTVAGVRSYVDGTLREWLSGYSDPWTDGLQRRVELTDVDDEGLYIRVTRANLHGGFDRRDKHYRIYIGVEEVDRGAETGRENRRSH